MKFKINILAAIVGLVTGLLSFESAIAEERTVYASYYFECAINGGYMLFDGSTKGFTVSLGDGEKPIELGQKTARAGVTNYLNTHGYLDNCVHDNRLLVTIFKNKKEAQADAAKSTKYCKIEKKRKNMKTLCKVVSDFAIPDQ